MSCSTGPSISGPSSTGTRPKWTSRWSAPGEWRGREAVLDALWNREPGLGAADWGYEDVWRDWYEAEDRVIVELRERSWLKSDPKDVMDQRTCCILKFRSDRISEIRDYTDSHIYEEYLQRHHGELPKFRQR